MNEKKCRAAKTVFDDVKYDSLDKLVPLFFVASPLLFLRKLLLSRSDEEFIFRLFITPAFSWTVELPWVCLIPVHDIFEW